MPAYDKHLISGFATFLFLAFIISTPTTTQANYISWLFFCLFGSLFPDIDTKSHIQRWFYTLTVLGLICAYMAKFEFSYLLTLLFVPLIVKHRGLFHNPKFLLILSFGLAFLFQLNGLQNYHNYWILALFFLAGAYSHLILDLGFKKFSYKLLKR